MGEQEMHDFMSVSVDSFSQLPFIRSASKPTANSASPVRLFGYDVNRELSGDELISPGDAAASKSVAGGGGGGGGESTVVRKFECHYCFRNFPTSQALGGHQNAHKRERQHAKRAHFQSAMAAQHHASMVVNYHGFGTTVPPPHYPSWMSSTSPSLSPGSRVYGGFGPVAQPVSLIQGLWRIPSHGEFDGERSMALPLFKEDEKKLLVGLGGGGSLSSSSSSSSSSSTTTQQERRGYGSGEKGSVSLDLTL